MGEKVVEYESVKRDYLDKIASLEDRIRDFELEKGL